MNKIFKILIALLLISTASLSQIRIKAVGDVMPGSITPKRVVPPDSGRVFVDSLNRFFSSADIVMGNLEGSFIEPGMTANKCSDTSRALGRCYEFGIPSYISKSLRDIGFNLLSNDNNHYKDYSTAGVRNTEKVVSNLGINYLGVKGATVFNIKNRNVVVLPFSTNKESNYLPDIENAKETVKAYRDSNYIVIVTFHGGKEGKGAQNIKDEEEIFLGENRGNIYQFARGVIDSGASLVIGHGPHVLRAMDIYKGKLIAYSLGNFLTYGNVNIQGVSGVSVLLDVTIDEFMGDFLSGSIIPFRQKSPGIPYYDNSGEGIKLIQKLTQQDLPNSGLIISDTGELNLK
ncbi:MAG: CapA family protein [Ignavibacteriaceae bacterium]